MHWIVPTKKSATKASSSASLEVPNSLKADRFYRSYSLMNPSTLHFSRANALLQLLAMFLMVGVALWAISDSRPFATPEPPPALIDHTEQGGPLIFTSATRHESPTDQLTGGWFTVGIMSLCLLFGAWEIGMKSWRLLSSKSAFAVRNGMLELHPSFPGSEHAIPLSAIRFVIFDRSDRVEPEALSALMAAASLTHRLAMKLGGRLRHVLLIEFETSHGSISQARIGDAEVEGGVMQMERFTEYLRSMAGSQQQR